MKKPKAVPPRPRMPWDPVEFELAEVSAIKAMAAQHPRAFEVVLQKICRLDAMSFTAGGEDGRRASDYAEGKRAVGDTLRQLRDLAMPSPVRGAPADLPNSPTPMPASAEPQT
jgi:hypothetical protein